MEFSSRLPRLSTRQPGERSGVTPRPRRRNGAWWRSQSRVVAAAARATNAAKHYDADQLAALVCAIALINTYNRLNVICQNQGGDYKPGQWG